MNVLLFILLLILPLSMTVLGIVAYGIFHFCAAAAVMVGGMIKYMTSSTRTKS